MPPKSSHSYKETTLQQLRSFCETARLGSFTAAADHLGLAQPTVWGQVHALERQFGVKLVEPHGRGCRLTDAGRLLASVAAPPVESIGLVGQQFREALGLAQAHLSVATTPRILLDDLPSHVGDFKRHCPGVRITFHELSESEVPAAVLSGEADLGITPDHGPPRSPLLVFEPCCQCDIVLITPKNHPLARRRQIRPGDMIAYPLVNSPDSAGTSEVNVRMEKLGVFRAPASVIQAQFATTIRQYVKLGLGIGIIPLTPAQKRPAGFHTRSMSRYFGKHTIYIMWRKDAPQLPAARAFVETMKMLMNGKG